MRFLLDEAGQLVHHGDSRDTRRLRSPAGSAGIEVSELTVRVNDHPVAVTRARMRPEVWPCASCKF